MLPRIALRKHCVFIEKRRDQVNVIWHDNIVGQLVPVAVEMRQAVADDLSQLGPPQHACAMTSVERVVPTRRQGAVELFANRVWNLFQPPRPIGGVRINAMSLQKLAALAQPPVQYRLRNRVPGPPRNEDQCAS